MATTPSTPPTTMRDQLLRESVEMIRYAFAKGKSVPTSVVDVVEQYQAQPALDPSALVQAHGRLAKLVSPATPMGIVLLAGASDGGRWSFLGPVPLVRRLMKTALACVVAFMLLSLTKLVNGTDIDITHSRGLELLINELFWLSAAGIGASFTMLFQVNEYIVRSNYDPKYEPSYWIKFFLGVMAGFILVTLLPIPEPTGAESSGTLHLAKPTIAMLGGYSASAVYRILTRLVEAIESLFRGNTKDIVAEREQAVLARAAEESSSTRVRLAAKLVSLQQIAAAGGSGDDLATKIHEIITTLTPEVGESETIVAPTAQSAPDAAPDASSITVPISPEALVASVSGASAAASAAASGGSGEEPQEGAAG
ncbi:MAG TPA: hypothetical protein VFR81_18250 [Longimicrobium sp.]|nr:hypothetical protein [Longimicrobium sp.]